MSGKSKDGNAEGKRWRFLVVVEKSDGLKCAWQILALLPKTDKPHILNQISLKLGSAGNFANPDIALVGHFGTAHFIR